MFTSILCPIDCSEHSERALGYAIDLAQRTGGAVDIVIVVDALIDAAAHASGTSEAVTADTRREVDAVVDRVLAQRPSSRRPEVHVRIGNPAEEILKTIGARSADLVVMGTKGLHGARRFVFGSTTERVLRDSHVPVLAVPVPQANA